jgi:hypothetical protein
LKKDNEQAVGAGLSSAVTESGGEQGDVGLFVLTHLAESSADERWKTCCYECGVVELSETTSVERRLDMFKSEREIENGGVCLNGECVQYARMPEVD